MSVLTELEQIPLDFLPLVMTVQLLEYCLTIMSFACTELSYKDLWFQNACVSHQLDYFCVFCIQHFIPSIRIFIQICMQLGMFTYTHNVYTVALIWSAFFTGSKGQRFR